MKQLTMEMIIVLLMIAAKITFTQKVFLKFKINKKSPDSIWVGGLNFILDGFFTINESDIFDPDASLLYNPMRIKDTWIKHGKKRFAEFYLLAGNNQKFGKLNVAQFFRIPQA